MRPIPQHAHDGDVVLPVRIGLKERNLEHGDRFLDDISDPDSPNFGKHWTAERVANTFAPSQQASDTTLAWLREAGIGSQRVKHSVGRNWLEFSATVSELEALLNTQYHNYQHKQSGGFRVACDEYGLPQHVRPHVDFIMPTIQLDGLQPVAQTIRHEAVASGDANLNLTDLSHCGKLVTINCLRELYKIPAGKYNHTGNKLGIAEWADYLYLPDLPKFFELLTTPKIPADTVPEFVSIDRGKESSLARAKAQQVVESALDFQTAYSIIWPQQTRLYQVGDGVNVDSVGTFNIFLDALDASYCTYQGGDQPYVDPAYPDPNDGGYQGPLQCGGAPSSNVISISYGQIEGALPRFYQERQCREWMKLALQGVSVVVASGDSGVANRYNAGYNNSCLNAESGYVDEKGTRFSPSFPVNCPYITAVGATTLRNGSLALGEEAVAGPNGLLSYYSGGGFSSVFGRPSWQSAAVSKYLDKYVPAYGESVFNSSGRGYPDVSAIGDHMPIIWLNKTESAGGTSVSAPIFASLITLLNEERLEAGKKPIGFLNPILYKYPDMFNDVTAGSNPGCGTDGFPASPGWDPVTGLGTPNYEKMREVFLKL
ncbi:uncharacterized protein SETTUDRAFT_177490 [Exserohilum turcica Et28A]|uniref:tripeptidyl-peptidase II n=1 Tax=Exserohilum turcicum (strain 28A) TaxID=671987 RepID=R0ILU9_EXST2|nr:uncharacterized protein SETTUDRAFT_177490 [Exserohilum turcica Et28A]EOA86025.1 hypothetical protein SETTUDRAFT_177490 [Exserohilum turcica Et28A]